MESVSPAPRPLPPRAALPGQHAIPRDVSLGLPWLSSAALGHSPSHGTALAAPAGPAAAQPPLTGAIPFSSWKVWMSPSDNASLVPGALIWGEMRDPDFSPPALQGPPKENRAVNFTQGEVTGGTQVLLHIYFFQMGSLSQTCKAMQSMAMCPAPTVQASE